MPSVLVPILVIVATIIVTIIVFLSGGCNVQPTPTPAIITPTIVSIQTLEWETPNGPIPTENGLSTPTDETSFSNTPASTLPPGSVTYIPTTTQKPPHITPSITQPGPTSAPVLTITSVVPSPTAISPTNPPAATNPSTLPPISTTSPPPPTPETPASGSATPIGSTATPILPSPTP